MKHLHPVPATHVLELTDLTEWLAEYGFDARYVTAASIEIGHVRGTGLAAWLDITFYKLNEQGKIYVDPGDPDNVARGTASVPLRSWPPLTERTADL